MDREEDALTATAGWAVLGRRGATAAPQPSHRAVALDRHGQVGVAILLPTHHKRWHCSVEDSVERDGVTPRPIWARSDRHEVALERLRRNARVVNHITIQASGSEGPGARVLSPVGLETAREVEACETAA
jgi:hypothetical protein